MKREIVECAAMFRYCVCHLYRIQSIYKFQTHTMKKTAATEQQLSKLLKKEIKFWKMMPISNLCDGQQ